MGACVSFNATDYIDEPVYKYWNCQAGVYKCPECNENGKYAVSYISKDYFIVNIYHVYRCLNNHIWLRILDDNNSLIEQKIIGE